MQGCDDVGQFWLLAPTLVVWYGANTLSSTSASLFITKCAGPESCFRDQLWLDLTIAQLFMGATIGLSIAGRSDACKLDRENVFAFQKTEITASLANTLALLAMNGVFCMYDARQVQVIKALEPVFTMLISTMFGSFPSKVQFGASLLVCFGVILSGSKDTPGTLGVVLGLVSAFGMPLRNVLVKGLELPPCLLYAKFCMLGCLMLSPFWLFKQFWLVQRLCLPYHFCLGTASYVVYNLASMFFLSRVSPLTHSIANCVKRFVSMTLTGLLLGLSWPLHVAVGMLFTSTGVALYSFEKAIQNWHEASSCRRPFYVIAGVVGAVMAVTAVRPDAFTTKGITNALISESFKQNMTRGKVATVGVYDPDWPRPPSLTQAQATAAALGLGADGPAAWESARPLKTLDNMGNLVWSLGAWSLLGGSQPYAMRRDLWTTQASTIKVLLVATGPLIGPLSKDSRIKPLSDAIAALPNVPVVVLGMGLNHHNCSAELNLAALAFLRQLTERVQSRGGFIGVRGECTQQMMRTNGFSNSEVLGCPSLFINASQNLAQVLSNKYRQLPERLAAGHLRVGLLPPAIGDRLKEAFFNLSSMVLQDDYNYIYQTGAVPGKAPSAANFSHSGEQLWFYDAREWQKAMSSFDLIVSARIHGSMIALAAGTPVIDFPPDIRVQELCDSMAIPNLKLPAGALGPERWRELISQGAASFDAAKFQAKRLHYAQRYKDLFASVGLTLNEQLKTLLET